MSKSEHESTPGWCDGVQAAIGWVKYRQSVMPDSQMPAYKAALSDVLVHLEAMLTRGTAAATSTLDSQDDLHGVVVAFNPDSLWGEIKLRNKKLVRFHSTSHHGLGWPYVGERVEVVTSDISGGLLSVHEVP
jgi:hypothetical protein